MPEISVVIPTRRRETRLAFALDALAAQTIARERFEVIVVRDSDTSPPLASAPAGLDVRPLALDGVAGPAPKRNLGWRAARAPLVAFTDDDCRPAPDWLERLLLAAGSQDVILQGRTEPDPGERHLLHGHARSVEITGSSGSFETCNIAYPRALLERMGGFDETFDFIGDDVDLGERALAGGADRIYVDEALVWHAVHARPLPQALKQATDRRFVPRVVARHPDHRNELYLGVFIRRRHATLALALAGGLAFRRRPILAAAAAIPYVRHTRGRVRLTPWNLLRLLTHVPACALVDGTEAAAAAIYSVRYRALVL